MHRPLVLLSLLVLLLLGACRPEEPLDQGWSDERQRQWFDANQGSRLIPLSWLRALQRADGSGAFLDEKYLEGMGYRWRSKAGGGLDLPRGFSIDQQADQDFTFTHLRWKSAQAPTEPWVGLTCAACHTGEVTFGDTRLVIFGAPTMADFQSFIEALDASVAATAADPAQFDRFANSVLGPAAAQDAPLLRQALTDYVQHRATLAELNRTPLRYGYGRVDAVGHILNKVALLASADPIPNPPNAPVSYPFLWNVPQHDRVQWNGMVENGKINVFDYGAVARNAGEVIGVFGDVRAETGKLGYSSSVDVDQLARLENMLGELYPPRWPHKLLGRIDEPLASKGKALFGNECSHCHEVIPRDNLRDAFRVRMVRLFPDGEPDPEGTDPAMACNTALAQSWVGNLAQLGESPDQMESLALMLRHAVVGVIIGRKKEFIGHAALGALGIRTYPKLPVLPASTPFETAAAETGTPPLIRNLCAQIDSDLIAYKARPLNGIWATAPYLHNGSVRSLYQLLLPAAQRDVTFRVGSTRFDPREVGFVTASDDPNRFEFDTRIPGNLNTGHEYGAGKLTDSERLELLEYLKTL